MMQSNVPQGRNGLPCVGTHLFMRGEEMTKVWRAVLGTAAA